MVTAHRVAASFLLLVVADCAQHPCRTDTGGALCQSVIPPVDMGYNGAWGTVASEPRRVMLWIQDEAAPGGGWRVDLRPTASAGGHTYALTTNGIFGMGDGLFGSVVIATDASDDLLKFDLVGTLAGVGDLPADGRGHSREYRFDALLTRKWCSCDPQYSSEANCCQTCGGETYRHYQVTRSAFANGGIYLFVADEPPRGCGSGVDLLEMEFEGS